MTTLTVYRADTAERLEHLTALPEITERLAGIGVALERWAADSPLAPDADQAAVLAAYDAPVERLNARYGFQSVDVVAVTPDNPKKAELRGKFLAEHTHDDFEVRFFVDGRGLFYLHVGGRVYAVLCKRGDLIAVPAGTTHWFDMGESPTFKCIRFFTTPEGWVGQFTGSDIAGRFPDFDHYVADLAG
jgi:1,2-dihydroxy-3-keto-5-methylthiopentene dioxygenase